MDFFFRNITLTVPKRIIPHASRHAIQNEAARDIRQTKSFRAAHGYHGTENGQSCAEFAMFWGRQRRATVRCTGEIIFNTL